MFGAKRVVDHWSLWLAIGVAGFVTSVALQAAQSTVHEDHSAYFGGWTLNRDLSSLPGTPDGPAGRGGGSGAGRGGGGSPGGRFGGSGGGGGFGPPGGAGGRSGSPSVDPKQMEETMELLRELMTPAAHWVVTSTEDGTVVFTDADGRSSRFVPNDKKEKHQLTAGTVETQTKWDKGQLRQEISLPGGMKAVRVFVAMPETEQLAVTTTMEGGPGGSGGPGGRRPPFRIVYDRDEER